MTFGSNVYVCVSTLELKKPSSPAGRKIPCRDGQSSLLFLQPLMSAGKTVLADKSMPAGKGEMPKLSIQSAICPLGELGLCQRTIWHVLPGFVSAAEVSVLHKPGATLCSLSRFLFYTSTAQHF